MNIKEAERIVQQYGGSLAKGTEYKRFRREKWLKTTKENIIAAHKLIISFLYENKSWNQENFDLYMTPLLALDVFQSDEIIDRMINTTIKLDNKQLSFDKNIPEVKEVMDYMLSMRSQRIADNIDDFLNNLYKISPDDKLYHQKVYTLAGIEYSPEKKESFWDVFKF